MRLWTCVGGQWFIGGFVFFAKVDLPHEVEATDEDAALASNRGRGLSAESASHDSVTAVAVRNSDDGLLPKLVQSTLFIARSAIELARALQDHREVHGKISTRDALSQAGYAEQKHQLLVLRAERMAEP